MSDTTSHYVFGGIMLRNTETDEIGFLADFMTDEIEGIAVSDVLEVQKKLRLRVKDADNIEVLKSFSINSSDGGNRSQGNSQTSGQSYGLTPKYENNHLRYEVMEIDSMVQRNQRNYDNNQNRLPDTPVIDMYEPWRAYPQENAATKFFGMFQSLRHWINSDEDREKFELYTGLKLDDMPVYDGKSSPNRDLPVLTADGEIEYTPERFEVMFDEPVKVIVEVSKVWDKEAGAHKMREDDPETFVERKRFAKWYGEWEAEVAAAAAAAAGDDEDEAA